MSGMFNNLRHASVSGVLDSGKDELVKLKDPYGDADYISPLHIDGFRAAILLLFGRQYGCIIS